MEHSGVKFLFAGLIAVAALMTAFRPRASDAPDSNRTVITLSFWGSYEDWGFWKETTDLFHEKNPDVCVKINYIPDNYDDKMRLLLAADSAPDVMLMQDEPLPSYASYGKFEDLTDWVHSKDFPIDWDKDYWPTVPESFTYKGRVMGVPFWGGNVLVIYNRKMFHDMGVAEPSDDWTFDDFVAKARELTRDTDGDGRLDTFGFSMPLWYYFLPFTWGFGADYLDAARTGWAFTGPEAVAATAFFQDLRFRYHVAPSIQEAQNAFQEGAMFMTGRIGMMIGGPWNCPPLMTAGVDFDVAHIPIGPVGKRYTRVTWDGLCLFKKSKHKPEALRFIKYCMSMEVQSHVGYCVRSIPTLKAARDSFKVPGSTWHETRFIDALEYGRVQPISLKWDAMFNTMVPEYDLLLLNKVTPEECVARIAEDMRRDHIFPIEDGQ